MVSHSCTLMWGVMFEIVSVHAHLLVCYSRFSPTTRVYKMEAPLRMLN